MVAFSPISVQPELVMIGLDKAVKEYDTVIIFCAVYRLYPALKVPTAFTLTWGQDAPISATQTANGDGKTFSYSVKVPKKVSREDNGKVVTCSIIPDIGIPVTITKRLNVQSEYLLMYVTFSEWLLQICHYIALTCENSQQNLTI